MKSLLKKSDSREVSLQAKSQIIETIWYLQHDIKRDKKG